MKKSILFLAGAALLFVGCAKVEDEAPIPENGKRVVTLKATVNEADTKVSVESDGTYQWQSGDEIGVWVVDSDGGAPYPYTTQDSGTTANFEVSLDAGEDIGEYAFYPFSEDHFVSGEGPRFALDANLQYVEDATNMPMLGTVSNGAISFKSVGGVIKLTVNNIPSDAARLLFSAKDLNGDDLFISGVFPVSGDQINAGGIMGVNSVNIDFTGKWQSSMVFYVPLPTGTYGGFEIEFDNANSSKTLASKKVNFGTTGLTVSRNEIILAPALDAAPDYSGEWILVGEHNNSFFACPAYTSGDTNIDGVEVSISGNVVTSEDNTIKMTFTKVTSGDYKGLYTIQDANDWYLYAASSSSNNLKAKSSIDNGSPANYYWSIEDDGNGGFSIVASLSSNRNKLRYNGTNNLFACYITDSSTGSNVKLYRWDDAVIETPEPSGDVWALVTDASDLAAGDVIVFASNEWDAVAGSVSNDFLTKVNAVFSSDKETIDNLPSGALQFTLGESSSAWTLTTDAGQMYSDSQKLRFSTTETYIWAISISSDGNADVSYGNDRLQYNSNSPRFKTYTSVQKHIQIYRKQAPESSYATVNMSNVTLGTGGSFNSTGCQVTIKNETVDGAKVGGGSSGGSVRITVPQGTKVLHLHLAGWKDEIVKVNITRTTAGTSVGETITLRSDTGVTGNGPYTLAETNASKFYHAVTLSNSATGLADDLTLDISSAGTSGEKRFIMWGVNYE